MLSRVASMFYRPAVVSSMASFSSPAANAAALSTAERNRLTDFSDLPPLLAGKDILAAKQFDRTLVEHVLKAAGKMKNIVKTIGSCELIKGKVLLNVFMEPSTRTASSFHTAMLRLGGSVVPVHEITSSAQKGETLEDTIRVVDNYADVIVLRHPVVGSADLAARYAKVPVLNAGDGQGEHPTQALLDSFCIYDQLGKLDGLTITMVGDLKYGRTVHSLSSILSHFDVKINFVSSETLRIPDKVIKELNSKNVKFNEILGIGNLNKVIPETDVLYMTRVQKERFPTEEAYKKEKGSYIVGKEFLDNAKSKPTLKVLHPLPRVDELLPSLDEDPRACYFQQVGYGLFTRMALLHEVLRSK